VAGAPVFSTNFSIEKDRFVAIFGLKKKKNTATKLSLPHN
jgi:hypothetical protein